MADIQKIPTDELLEELIHRECITVIHGHIGKAIRLASDCMVIVVPASMPRYSEIITVRRGAAILAKYERRNVE